MRIERIWGTRSSIKRSLNVLVLVATSVALGLAASGLASFEVIAFRDDLEQHLSILADMASRNSVAALLFDDAAAANETVRDGRSIPVREWNRNGSQKSTA